MGLLSEIGTPFQRGRGYKSQSHTSVLIAVSHRLRPEQYGHIITTNACIAVGNRPAKKEDASGQSITKKKIHETNADRGAMPAACQTFNCAFLIGISHGRASIRCRIQQQKRIFVFFFAFFLDGLGFKL